MSGDLSTDVLTKLREFCSRFFKSNILIQQKVELSRQLNKYVATIFETLCERLNTEILDREPNVISISGPCFVFGDIHGNLEDIFDYENKFWLDNTDSRTSFVFLGDFVDRGLFSVEVSLYLFALKLSEPQRFILVRGNHEVRSVNKGYTFYRECIGKFGPKTGNEVWDHINTSFERLPLAAVIDSSVFCCHGGVPKSVTSVEDMLRFPKPLVDPAIEAPAAHEMLWNDPIESMAMYTKTTERVLKQKRIDFIPNKTRSTGFYFTASGAKHFLDANGFTFMIRAHESVDEGFRYTSDNRVITVFSSSNYCGKSNTTACVKVSAHQIQICIIKRPKNRGTTATPPPTLTTASNTN